MSHKVYINAIGKHLPGEPVPNEAMEDYLGLINGQPSRTKSRMLQQNGITSRYYAINKEQASTDSVAGMAAKAIKDTLAKANVAAKHIELLAAGTTQNDLPIPGFASMVHAGTEIPVCAISSFQSVCAAGMMAVNHVFQTIKNGEVQKAVACAADFPSRLFKAKRFAHQQAVVAHGLDLETDFLRWMLSDGAGAFYMSHQPNAERFSFEVEWIDIRSHAHLFEPCMYTGMRKNADGSMGTSWIDYDSFTDADADAALNLRQDIRLVNNIIALGVQHFFNLVDAGKIDPKRMDWLVAHYSSEYFKNPIVSLLEKGGLVIPEEKWFTNLHTKGNTGAASIFIMLEELLNEKELVAGQEILCMVPESGRFITTFMKLKVIAPTAEKRQASIDESDEILAPDIRIEGNPTQEWLVRQLVDTWVDFETHLRKVPIIQKIYKGTITLEDYKLLLLNLRQQVIDGSQWIARAASNVSMEYFDIRSSFISHSRDEHRDYQILEKNYINCGGNKEDLYTGEKNIGSEALSAFMFQRASQPNPFDLLGGMFIIEGLGNRIAGNWGRAIQGLLNLDNDQVSFFTYHETSDSNDNHFERFENALNSDLLDMNMARRIAKTAKVVASLYRMQLAEIGNY
ncbi:MAG: hypothetical protein BGO31_04235 [Bacteroidetes bacterium 43-16]|nr:MAG: hypothetical protein BGO31_04235 [Bacteroidetes bacterium 43-16]